MAKRDLRGRVAIVTGASSGVGWQTALRLAEEGVRLCVTARRQEALDRLCAEVRAKGVDCIAVAGDVTVEADVVFVVDECLREFGRIDLLVNDAAVQAYAKFEDLEWREITRTFDVTCFGYLRFARAVLPIFRRQGQGHIINVLSMLSVGAAPLLSAYTAAKHALYGWAECLRLELHGSGIDVSGVLVPSVATPMFDHAPTKLNLAPRPVPPTYDPDVAARAVVRCAKKPNPKSVPVFLQGRLTLWVQRWAPWAGDFVLEHWGEKLQVQDRPLDRPEGNLYRPVARGVGPRGSVPPTPRWKRYGATAALAAIAGGAIAGTGWLGSKAARTLG